MNKEHLEKFIGTTKMTIVDAMGKIDINAKGILFLVDEQRVLLGCITDGDIRRWLIKSGDLNASVENAMVISPKFLYEEDIIEAEHFMKKKQIIKLKKI